MKVIKTLALAFLLLLGSAGSNMQAHELNDPMARALEGRDNSIVILHLEKPDAEYMGGIRGIQWLDADGIPHIMLAPPYTATDEEFMCVFNHEYSHIIFGLWHSTYANSTCGPDVELEELQY